MPVDVLTETIIQRRRSEVAAFACDPQNAPRWYENIRSIEWVGEPGLRVGAKAAFVASFLGRRLAYTYEIADYVAGERLVMRTADGPFPMETTYTFSDAGDGATRMTLRNCGEPTGFSRLLQPFMQGAMRSANRKDLALLKALLEGAG
jgi:hypothetical protein